MFRYRREYRSVRRRPTDSRWPDSAVVHRRGRTERANRAADRAVLRPCVGTGILVATIEPDSPAAKSQLREGDVIIALDGHHVSGIDQLHRLLTEERIGKDNALTVIRRTEKMEISVTPAESPRRQG